MLIADLIHRDLLDLKNPTKFTTDRLDLEIFLDGNGTYFRLTPSPKRLDYGTIDKFSILIFCCFAKGKQNKAITLLKVPVRYETVMISFEVIFSEIYSCAFVTSVLFCQKSDNFRLTLDVFEL